MKTAIKKTILLFAILFNLVSYSQQDAPEQAPKSKLELPNFSPPSPEAFQITKYGDVPIDEYNGKVNLNIPIYQYQAGQLKLPISLNYYAAGVKVNDIATQTGINWNLSAGGAITREARDLADEEGVRFTLTAQETVNLNKEDCTPEVAELLKYIALGNGYDTEVDIFNFSFAGYSGSFFLDDNFNPVMVKNEHQLKIEIVGGNTAYNLYHTKIFRITDPNGIKYYFGGDNATEATVSRTITKSVSQNTGGGNTSFYLYRIEHPVNGTILLDYDTLTQYEVSLGLDYSTTTYQKTLSHCPIFRDSQSYSEHLNNILTPRFISRIHSLDNDDEVIFDRSSISNIQFKTILNDIRVIKNDTLFSKIDFNYSGLEEVTTPRFFLTKVSIDKDLQLPTEINKKYQEYRMEYNDPEDLPSRASYDIDMLGYFNNTQNSNLFPCLYENPARCPNREPNFQYASKGVLKKIIYPTGGYTQFEYEPQPTLTPIKESVYSEVYINYISNEETQIPETNLHDEFPKTEGGTTIFEMPVTISRPVEIELMCYTYVGGGPNGESLSNVTLKITNFTHPNKSRSFRAINERKLIPFTFEAGSTYKIEIDMVRHPHSLNDSTYQAWGSCNFVWDKGLRPIPSSGVRVKKTTDFTSANSPALTKRFYYTAYEKRDDITADVFNFQPKTSDGGFFVDCKPPGATFPDYNIYTSHTKYSNYIFSDFENTTLKPRTYPSVTVSYGGDNFEMGGIEKRFRVAEEAYYQQIVPLSAPRIDINYNVPNAKDNLISLDGLLLKEKTFKNINGSIFKVKEQQFEYEYPVISAKNNLFGFMNFENKFQEVSFIRSITIENYGHTDPNDPLNPNYGNTSNVPEYYLNNNAIKNYLKGLLKDHLQTTSDPYFNIFDSMIAEGSWTVLISFSEDYNTANVTLRSSCGNVLMPLSNYFVGIYNIFSYKFRKTKELQKQYMDPVPANLIAAEPTDINPFPPTQDDIEIPYKKVITSQTYEYGTLNGLPTKVTMTTSDSAKQMITKNTYADQASTLSVTGVPLLAYQSLVTQNNIASPIQVEELENTELLSKQRTFYKQWNGNPNHIMPEIIQTAKATESLEDRVVITEYDPKGNPSMVSYKNGAKTKYFYNSDNQVIVKIDNYKGPLGQFTVDISNPCVLISTTYPAESFVTVYTYDAVTKLLSTIINPNCKSTFYKYDSLHRLWRIKDDQDNILQEFDNNYKPQN